MRFKIGDIVTVKQIPPGINKMPKNTRAIFKYCLGKAYTIRGFGKYGHIELMPNKLESIWIEPEFVSLRRRQCKCCPTNRSSGADQ